MKKAKTAVILEDELTDAKILSALLNIFGIEAFHFRSIPELEQGLNTVNPDYYFIDINVGEIGSGFSVIERIKALPIQTLVFVISGDERKDSVTHAIELGADDYFSKPIKREVFTAKFERLLDIKGHRDSKPLVKLPADGIQTQIVMDFSLDEITESGFKIASKNLLSKGTSLILEGDFSQMGLHIRSRVKLTVVSNWVDTGTGLYYAIAEFDPEQTEVISSVREWLNKVTAA